MTDSMRIAVLGAGYIGTALAEAAAALGHTVWAVRRTSVPALPSAVQWLTGDVARGEIPGFPATLDAIILTIAPSRGADDYDATYPPAAASAVTMAANTGARAVLYTSSTGVYGGRDGEMVTEASPRRGEGGSASALVAAEDLILSATTVQPCVLRVAGIYGPGRDPRGRMANAELLPQRGEYWTNLAHRDDIISAMLHLLAQPSLPAIVNVCDSTPTRAADVARWLAASRGEDPASLRFTNESTRSRNHQRVSNARLVATGWAPRYPAFSDGFARGL